MENPRPNICMEMDVPASKIVAEKGAIEIMFTRNCRNL